MGSWPLHPLALARALVLLGAASVPGEASGMPVCTQSEDGVAELLRSVEPGIAPAELERLASELARVPRAACSYLAISTAGVLSNDPDQSSQPLTSEQLEVLSLSAPLLEHRSVVLCIEEGAREECGEAWRRAALDLLRWHANVSEVPLLLRLVLDEKGVPPSEGPILDAFQAALVEVLRREPEISSKLDWLAGTAGPMRAKLIHALGTAHKTDALPWIANRLDDADLNMVALREIGRLAKEAAPGPAAVLAAKVRPFLRSTDPGMRVHAIRALAALEDEKCIPRLISIVQTTTGGEQETATSALHDLTGRSFPERGSAWSNWYQDESHWIETYAAATVAQLASPREAEVIAAIRTLSARGLHRSFLATQISRVVCSHPSPTVRGQGCLGLARLGSSSACGALVHALEDSDSGVRHDALTALCSITKLSLPPDAEAWKAALNANAGL
jgi:HEAT repeat protein